METTQGIGWPNTLIPPLSRPYLHAYGVHSRLNRAQWEQEWKPLEQATIFAG
jgi:hypothetical protein